MKFSILSNTVLFRGINIDEAKKLLECLGSFEKDFDKDSVILHAGDCTDNIGMVLSGSANVEIDNIWGNKTILDHVEKGQLFAESYACIPGEPLMVSVVATEKTRVLFINTGRLFTPCEKTCGYHNKMIRNLLQISAHKNLLLSRRSLHTSSKSIRGRLQSYLSHEAKQKGSYQFTIPFDRQQLADYLGVDRSALSNELSKMQKEGLLTFEKNRFSLKDGQ